MSHRFEPAHHSLPPAGVAPNVSPPEGGRTLPDEACAPRRAASPIGLRTIGSVAAALCVFWLAGRGWIVFNTDQQPYVCLGNMTIAILASAAAAAVCGRRGAGWWRAAVVAAGALACLAGLAATLIDPSATLSGSPLIRAAVGFAAASAAVLGAVVPVAAILVPALAGPAPFRLRLVSTGEAPDRRDSAFAANAPLSVRPSIERAEAFRTTRAWLSLASVLIAVIALGLSAANSASAPVRSSAAIGANAIQGLFGTALVHRRAGHAGHRSGPVHSGKAPGHGALASPAPPAIPAPPRVDAARAEAGAVTPLLPLALLVLALRLSIGAGLRWALGASEARSRGRAGFAASLIAVCIALCGAAAGVTAFCTPAFNFAGQLQHPTLFGSGFLGEDPTTGLLSILLQEQGIVSIALAGLLAAGIAGVAVLAATRCIAPEPDGLALCAGALAILIVIPSCAVRLVGSPDWLASLVWLAAIALAALRISARAVDPQSGAADALVRRRRARVWAVALAALPACAAAAILAGAAVTAATTRTSGGHPMPLAAVVRTAALDEAPVAPTWPQVHDAFLDDISASAMPVTGSMAGMLVGRAVDGSGPLARRMRLPSSFSALAGLALSHMMAHEEIVDRFVLGRDYGGELPPDARRGAAGLADAAQFFFRKPASDISAAQARFLIGTTSEAAENIASPLRLRPGDAPAAFTPSKATSFACKLMPIPAGAWFAHSGAMNAHGEVAGSVNGAGVVWQGGRVVTLSPWGGDPLAINDLGEAAGSYKGEAAVWDPEGRMKALAAVPGFEGSEASGINNSGQAVGYGYEPGGGSGGGLEAATHAVLWEAGKARDLGVPTGYISSRALAIDDRGEIAGWLLNKDDQTRAMVWKDGVFYDLGAFFGGRVSIATSINNRGQVAGAAQHGDGTVTAFVWQDGVMHDIGKLSGSEKARAYDINDLGQATGSSFTGDINGLQDDSKAFVWDSAHGMRDAGSLLAGDAKLRREIGSHMAAYSLNDDGQIMCVYEKSGATAQPRKMILLTPR